MYITNQSEVTEFFLVGFPNTEQLEIFFFFIFGTIYAWTVTANIVIILVVRRDRHLHTPMYFFICNLSLLEIWYTTVTTPKLMANFLMRSKMISLSGCIVQFYVFFSLGSTQCLLLAVMAFDRYLAICNPLRYNAVMTRSAYSWAAFCSWGTGFVSMLVPCILVLQLSFCSSNVINHFFCDADPLLKLSCTDTRLIEILDFLLALTIVLSSFMLTVVSYIYIISTVMRIPQSRGRGKAFSTCSSHLIIVVMFYTTVTFMYIRPRAQYSEMSKVVSVFHSVVTPLLNPFIYTLRNKDVKNAITKLIRQDTFQQIIVQRRNKDNITVVF
ncbi:olfactory receptor 287-like [Pleurodeles waltl]|uniref:olfactory receptor 287-like n=1 Tax=Pleurodeles waltl TaxID=8319 RepID=UPI003709B493